MELAFRGFTVQLLGMPSIILEVVAADTWIAFQLQRYVLLHCDRVR